MWATVIKLMGGLGLFISGMNMMSRGIEKVAGSKLRSILAAFTRNRFLGMVVGLIFTAIIQSSSAATVLAVSFVNSGLMTLTEASGIILGANIGTTVTAMLVAFKLSAIAPIFVLLGAVLSHYVKVPSLRKIGEVILGFGILFVGISTMSEAMTAIRDVPAVVDSLSVFTNPFVGMLMGLAITSVVQSSSVTVSILVVMGSQGLVTLDVCMYVILGCNIGACTSALLSGFAGGKDAKRTALIHLLFNIFGTILMYILLQFFSPAICYIICTCSGSEIDALGRNIACAHFLFKVFQVIVFYPLMPLIVKITYILVPGNDQKQETTETFFLEHIKNDHPSPTVAVYLAVQEMERMARMAIDNLNIAVTALIDGDTTKIDIVEYQEKYIDYLDEQISNYLVAINQNNLPLADAQMISAYFHVVNDIERIGDHAVSAVEIIPQIVNQNVTFSKKSKSSLIEMMALVNKILEESIEMFVTGSTDHMQEIRDLENAIDDMELALTNKHIKRLQEGKCTAYAGIYYKDILSGLERVGDHAINIAFSLVEAKNGKQGTAIITQ